MIDKLIFNFNPDEVLDKLTAESAFWFRERNVEHNRAEQFAARVREQNKEIAALKEEVEKLRGHRAEDAKRFEAITAFWHAARETGYNTSWSIGGLTLESLRAQTNEARNYKAPPTVLESDLVVVGKMDRDGALYRKNVIVPHGSTVEVVYVYRPRTAPAKPITSEKAKGKPKA